MWKLSRRFAQSSKQTHHVQVTLGLQLWQILIFLLPPSTQQFSPTPLVTGTHFYFCPCKWDADRRRVTELLVCECWVVTTLDGAKIAQTLYSINNKSMSEINTSRLTVNVKAILNIFKDENLLKVPAGKLHTWPSKWQSDGVGNKNEREKLQLSKKMFFDDA